MNKTTLFASVIIGMSVFASTGAMASTYDQLHGNWYVDFTKKMEDGSTMRICGTEKFLANGTSRVQGQAIYYIPQTDKHFGEVIAIDLDSSNKVEIVDDKIIRTTSAVDNKLTEFYFINRGNVVDVSSPVMNKMYMDELASYKSVVASLDMINQVQESTIVSVSPTHFVELEDDDTSTESVKIKNVITECN
jgi:hypothetical protein